MEQLREEAKRLKVLISEVRDTMVDAIMTHLERNQPRAEFLFSNPKQATSSLRVNETFRGNATGQGILGPTEVDNVERMVTRLASQMQQQQ